MRPFALHSGFYTLVCAHSRHHASLIQGACGSHTRLSQYLHRNVPAINSLIPEPLSCFFAERGVLLSRQWNEVIVVSQKRHCASVPCWRERVRNRRFLNQDDERAVCKSVRNAPRSKHFYEERSWTRSYRFAPGPLHSSRETDAGKEW